MKPAAKEIIVLPDFIKFVVSDCFSVYKKSLYSLQRILTQYLIRNHLLRIDRTLRYSSRNNHRPVNAVRIRSLAEAQKALPFRLQPPVKNLRPSLLVWPYEEKRRLPGDLMHDKRYWTVEPAPETIAKSKPLSSSRHAASGQDA